MASDREYEERVAKLGRRGVLSLWNQITAGRTPGWAGGKACEYCILRAFELEGAEIVWPYHVYDTKDKSVELEQIDGAIFVSGRDHLVSTKDEAEPIDIEPIAKLAEQPRRRPSGVIGLLFSRSGFTPPALKKAALAPRPTILLWQRAEIDTAVRKGRMVESLDTKYRYAVTHGICDYNILTPPPRRK